MPYLAPEESRLNRHKTIMTSPTIQKASLGFLKKLGKNNNREWFNRHKDEYLEARGNIIAFADALLTEMNQHDLIETPSGKDSLFRIYRDIRFSKNKKPYHTHWNGVFRRATRKLRGGYYFHLEPGASFLAGGFWGPEPQDMKRIRQDIELNYEDWNKLLSAKPLVSTFGKLAGEQISTAPRGYAKDHPAIHLLRYKQFVLRTSFRDDEVCSPRFVRTANEVYKKMRPFLNYMSEVLTTDANGEPLFD
jgi:uncharacterized protein (TIGR02453 family)